MELGTLELKKGYIMKVKSSLELGTLELKFIFQFYLKVLSILELYFYKYIY
jgi:hypothetical protein